MRRVQLRTWIGAGLLAGTTALTSSPAAAQDRLIRRLQSYGDIPLNSVVSLAQDTTGFLWLGTVGGLLRWDGVEFQRWAPERLQTWVPFLAACPGGRVFGVGESGPVFRTTAAGIEVETGHGLQGTGRWTLTCDTAGVVWTSDTRAVWRRARGGEWKRMEWPVGPAPPLDVLPGPGTGAWIRNGEGLWHVADGTPLRIAPLRYAQAVVLGPAGDTLVLDRWSGVHRLIGGSARPLFPARGRGVAMLTRQRTTWVAFDRSLVALQPDAPPRILGSELIPEGAGPLLVDQEGSLWMGTFTGLLQFPEPETEFWNDRHGLPSAHTRFVTYAGGRVWVSTWQGLGYMERRGGLWTGRSLAPRWMSQQPMYADRDDTLWIAASNALHQVVGTEPVRSRPYAHIHWDLEPDPAGVDGMLLATSAGLLHAPPGGDAVAPVADSPFPPGSPVRQILHTTDGRRWLAGAERICSRGREAWACDTLPGAGIINGLVQLPDGAVWAASDRQGILRWTGAGWERHPGSARLISPTVYRMQPAADGSVWILGHGRVTRVADLPGGGDWEIRETLTQWQGLLADAGDLLERPDGSLWLTTALGLAHIPPEARRSPETPPRVILLEVRADGAAVPADTVLRLRHRHNRVDVRFAAPSYRDPARLRYQVRLAPDLEWSDHRGHPSLAWIDLPQGRYRVEVRASLDGVRWSPRPASFALTVRAPWYLQSWALGGGALVLLLLIALAHQLRVAVLLRMERQRTRIAMDLHDEVGSGLGSIGILAGVVADDAVPAPERRRLAAEIGDTAGELGTALSDLVWSLRRPAMTLEEVSLRLVEHGTRLFAADGARFASRLPGPWPSRPLESGVSRAVLLVGLEALRNAARHAGARRVTLSVAPAAPGEWVLAVEDDGRGLPEGNDPSGHGLANMRRRAADIGARLEVGPAEAGGAAVRLRFRA